VTLPRGGYLVPAAYAEAVARELTLHGIRFRVLAAPVGGLAVESFRATLVTRSPQSSEGHTRLRLQGDWRADRRDVRAGALFVPIAQPKARLVATILEPRSPDSIASWGGFDAAFERHEYMEPYVAEQVGAQMLARDPAVKAAFEERLAGDPKFAADPAARLDFFYQRHPSWDETVNLYPVFRTACATVGEGGC
jgi:hypothetical protein